jgi:hypothetical protein
LPGADAENTAFSGDFMLNVLLPIATDLPHLRACSYKHLQVGSPTMPRDTITIQGKNVNELLSGQVFSVADFDKGQSKTTTKMQ